MGKDEEYPYIGVSQEDGGVQIEGPLSPERLKQRLKEETKRPVTVVHAKRKADVWLKILATIIGSENSKKKP